MADGCTLVMLICEYAMQLLPQGGAILAAALLLPGVLLPSNQASGSGTLLLGFLCAHCLRTSTALLFLADSATCEELCTWRHQRLNAVLGTVSVVAASIQLLTLLSATPLMTM